MFSKLASSALALATVFGAVAAHPDVDVLAQRDDDVCPPGTEPVVVYVSPYVSKYPVYIDTYIAANTIININGGVTINVNNAPTQLVTTVNVTTTGTLTETVTNTVTATATTTAAQASGTAATFVLQLAAVGAAKRQAPVIEYVGAGGVAVTDPAEAAVFSVTAGELFSGDEQISTDGTVDSALFATSATVQSITTLFTADAGSALSWANQAFTNGVASYCLRDNSVLAVFKGVDPSGCEPRSLIVVPTSSLPTSPSSSGAESSGAASSAVASNSGGSASSTSPPSITGAPTSSESGGAVTTLPGSETVITESDGSLSTTTEPGSVITSGAPSATSSDGALNPTASVSPDTSFVITVDDGSSSKYKRALSYLFFVNGVAETTDDETEASRFSSGEGQLFSGGKYVGLTNEDIAAGYGKFQTFDSQPDVSKTFNVKNGGGFNFDPSNDDGTSLGLEVSYCKNAETGEVYTRYSSDPTPFTCNVLSVAVSVVSTGGGDQSPGTGASTTAAASSTAAATSAASSTSSAQPPEDSDTPNFEQNTRKPKARSLKKKAAPVENHKIKRRGGLLRSPNAPRE